MNTADVLILAAVAVGAYIIYQRTRVMTPPPTPVSTVVNGIGGVITGIASLASGVYGEISQYNQSQ